MISPIETFDDRVLLKGNRLGMVGNPKGSVFSEPYEYKNLY